MPQTGTIDEQAGESYRLIDTHCHLDDPVFAGDIDVVVRDSIAASVRSWIVIGFCPERWDSTVRLADRFPGMAHTLGVHPQNADAWSDAGARQLADRVRSTEALAIGEIGLDFFRHRVDVDTQRTAFVDQLGLACELGLPVVVHMRAAEAEVLDILANQRQLPPVLFHSFDGGPALVDFILAHQCLVGVGGLATRESSSELRSQLDRIPLESIVLETDSPYLIPARQRSRRNTPAHVRTVAEFLADRRGIDISAVARTTTANAERFFGRLDSA